MTLIRLVRRNYSKLAKPSGSVKPHQGGNLPPVNRVSYEYPPPPNKKKLPKESSPWKRHLPILFGLGTAAWAFYAYNYLFSESGGEQTLLSPKKFTPFTVTHKQLVNENLMLLEVSPKWSQHIELLGSGGEFWNGKKLWSVEIKHPDIQIARKYTPLPMYFMHSAGGPSLLRLLGASTMEGRLVFLVKRYADGEMSRYLFDIPLGSQIELRGPHIEHAFKYRQVDMAPPRSTMLDVPTRVVPDNITVPKPDNIAFFGAGTGISPAFQMLFSPNPPRGLTQVYYSVKSRKDIPFERFMLFLENTGRAKFHIYCDDEQTFLSLKDIPKPVDKQSSRSSSDVEVSTPKYRNAVQQHQNGSGQFVDGCAQAIVCGPQGYVNYVAGDPGYKRDQPIGGLLGEANWDENNAIRMPEY